MLVLVSTNNLSRLKHVFAWTGRDAHFCLPITGRSVEVTRQAWYSRRGSEESSFKVQGNHIDKNPGLPVSMHLGPLVFGETSPRFVAANAATKSPFPGSVSLPLKCFSMRYDA